MVTYPNLVAAMAVREITQSALASSISVSQKTLRKKMDGKTDFKFGEAEKIQATFFPDIPILDLFTRAAPPGHDQNSA